MRRPEELQLHRSFEELGWAGLVDELNQAARLSKDRSGAEQILVTTNGTILAGFGHWRSALLEQRPEIQCIEYPLDDDESLSFILTHHQPWRGWNAFVRIRLAMTLTPHFQQRALDNMRTGGKYKGSADLPEAQHIDVREQIAGIAGAGARNVGNVKVILKYAHPRLIDALRDTRLTINRAIQLCKLPRSEQLEQFIRYCEERDTNKVIRQAIARSKKTEKNLNGAALLQELQQQEAKQPGSVVVRTGRLQRTVVIVGRDLLPEIDSSGGIDVT